MTPARRTERLPVRFFNLANRARAAFGARPPSFRSAVERLHERAIRSVGFDDFGDTAYRHHLDVLVNAYDAEATLTPFGRMLVLSQIEGVLANRLRAEKTLRSAPEIEAIPLERPIFVLGLPRTGTTALHHLLGQDPGIQVLEYWIAANPTPRPPRETWAGHPDFKKAKRELATTYWLDPGLKAIHLMTPGGPEECRHLLSQTFTDDTFDCNASIPSYTRWYDSCDMRPTYLQHRRLLQLIGSTTPAKRWVLKYPVHMRNLRTLLTVYPDACFVQCHRDPSKVLPSLCSLVAGWRAIYEGDVDRCAIARSQMELWARGLEHGMDVRREVDPARFFDLSFQEVLADPIDAVRRIYAHFELPIGADADRRFRSWKTDNPRGKHGEHHYVAEDFGVSAGMIRERFASYLSHFSVDLEENEIGASPLGARNVSA